MTKGDSVVVMTSTLTAIPNIPAISNTVKKIDIQPSHTKINKIIVSAATPASAITKDLLQQNKLLPLTTSNGNIITGQSLLTTPASVLTTENSSYQLLFTTVAKSHPRIKYSGLKKPDEKAIILETVNMPTLKTTPNTNILDISAITPLISSRLAPISTTITIPSSTTLQSNSQIINISSNDLTSAIKYADIDDIELPDGTKIGYQTDIADVKQCDTNNETSYPPSLAEKYSILAASTLKNFDFSLNDSTVNQSIMSESTVTTEDGIEELFACRHCGKKYRWKSTLRRHENDECGNKEPSHQCPYCPYKAKQRGNLGVHVRKHHSNMPQLESRRMKKKD